MQAPYCLAMVICDGIHRDPGTGKFTLLGTFSVIAANAFPAEHPIIALYVALTDGRGQTPLKVELVATEDEAILLTVEGDTIFTDPRAVSETVLVVRKIVFPRPGEYRFRLYGGDEFLMERRLLVARYEEKGTHDEQ